MMAQHFRASPSNIPGGNKQKNVGKTGVVTNTLAGIWFQTTRFGFSLLNRQKKWMSKSLITSNIGSCIYSKHETHLILWLPSVRAVNFTQSQATHQWECQDLRVCSFSQSAVRQKNGLMQGSGKFVIALSLITLTVQLEGPFFKY